MRTESALLHIRNLDIPKLTGPPLLFAAGHITKPSRQGRRGPFPPSAAAVQPWKKNNPATPRAPKRHQARAKARRRREGI